ERGRMQVASANPFTTEPVLSTPTARPAWPDARRAAVAFGDGGQTGFSHLHVAFDPTYHGGLGLLRSASEAELYVFEDARPPVATEPVLSTPTARPAWPDARRAAVAFGDGGQTGFSPLHVAFDPTYHGGLGLLRSASQAELYVFEDDRPPVAIRGALELGLNA